MKGEVQTGSFSVLKEVLSDVTVFADAGSGIRLRKYQRGVAEAVVTSVLRHQGKSFVVMFPRQSGKNELQAQIEAYLLMLFSQDGGDIVKISPTWKPQSLNAMRRLESTLRRNIITKDLWEKESGYIYRIGNARVFFLSGAPETNIVGATASLLLEVDEAQDVQITKFDRDIAPMAASQNATRIFWGTAWTADTLLARELSAARKAEQESQLPGDIRAFCIDANVVAAEVPAYGSFVSGQVRRLGRQHPLIRTQYFCEEIGGETGLFNEKRIAAMQGIHPPCSEPNESGVYILLIDVAGADETSAHRADQTGNAEIRDATAVTICRISFPTRREKSGIDIFPRQSSCEGCGTALQSGNSDEEVDPVSPAACAPVWEVLQRMLWLNIPLSDQYDRLTDLISLWNPERIVIDSTGIGAGIASFLIRAAGDSRVTPFTFSSASKSKLGWDFLAIIDSGRWHEYSDNLTISDPEQTELQVLFYRQLRFCKSELLPGPNKLMRWGVPEGLRDPASGEFVHDDLVFSAALAAAIDHDLTSEPSETLIIQASDPLKDLDRGF